jgi:hypothetical protein
MSNEKWSCKFLRRDDRLVRRTIYQKRSTIQRLMPKI